MFSNLLIGVVLGIGVGGWIYAQMQKRNGGQSGQSIKVALIAGLMVAFVCTTLLAMFL